jgi:hypothetical protein
MKKVFLMFAVAALFVACAPKAAETTEEVEVIEDQIEVVVEESDSLVTEVSEDIAVEVAE